jgi:hypothetical protein
MPDDLIEETAEETTELSGNRTLDEPPADDTSNDEAQQQFPRS